jgi:signal transduction histidine kinase
VTESHRLLVRILDIGSIVSVLIFLSNPLVGWGWESSLCMLLLCVGYRLSRLRMRHSLSQAVHLNLAFTWVALFCCDDGFCGKGGSWIYWIPFCLEALILLPAGNVRRAWIASPALAILLVNFTPWAPHFNRSVGYFPRPFYVAMDFAGAILVSYSCVHFMICIHAKALEERNQALERWKAAATAKSRFLSNMSHEFRTPLNAISGFTDLLLMDGLDKPEAQEYLKTIRTASGHLVHLINDVLDLSRMESGCLSLARVPFDPRESLEHAYSTLASQARDKGLAFQLRCEEAIPVLIGDPVRWTQVLLNLMGNAVKYTEKGRVDVGLSWLPEGEAGTLELTVEDTGPGIPSDRLESIFQRFERIDERDPSGTNGTGLGLAIVRSLARLMGGDVEVESRLGKGTVFRLRAHFAVSREAVAQIPTASPLPDLQGMRVLLCDDTPTNVRLASLILKRLNADCDVAEDGGAAVESLKRARYDLVLLDLHMPVLDGYQVARAVRSGQEGILDRNVPILALTADVSEETRIRTQAAGMNGFLAKPFRPSELARSVLALR